jgi:uncharacterized protein YecT (DUF1311 family)
MRRSLTAAFVFLLLAMPAAQAAPAARAGDLSAANAKLNAEYQKIMAQEGTPKDKTALRDLERAWIAYKDKQCLFEVGGDGTVQTPAMPLWSNYADCEIRVTNARTQELKGLECQGVSVCAVHSK